MANALRGEIEAELDGKKWTLCLTLGALAKLENALEVESLSELSQKFAAGKLRSTDLLEILSAGLLGGGYILTEEEIAEMRVEGGISGYIEIVTRLLEATFTPIQPA